MIASDSFEPTQALKLHQTFLPIFTTLFFAATTAPILLGFGGYEARARASGPIREGSTGNQVVVAQCDLAEHGQPGHRCESRRG